MDRTICLDATSHTLEDLERSSPAAYSASTVIDGFDIAEVAAGAEESGMDPSSPCPWHLSGTSDVLFHLTVPCPARVFKTRTLS